MPNTRSEFWIEKFNKNVIRDLNNYERLYKLGWRVVVVWECELKHPDEVVDRILTILNDD